jgi:1-acyl-sn-glycerol-3-phosphate acyltransferase
MDAASLQRYALFRHMGLFGVEPGTARGASAFLRIARAGLAEPDTVLGITAEGNFTDPRQRPITLRPGLAHLARQCPQAVFLPLALEYSFWNESKPEALLRFGTAVRPSPEGETSVAQWQRALETGLAETMDALTEASVQRNPALFTELFSGTAGVGGIYDLWRRARAMATGQRFNPRHETGSR